MRYFRPVLALLVGFLLTPASARELVSRASLALETFDAAWQVLNETHFDTNYNGHDWQSVREKYRPRAAAAENADELRKILQEMLDLLDVSHLAIVPGEVAGLMEAEAGEATALEEADENQTGSLGMEVRFDGEDLLVTQVMPGLPAARAGVRPGWILQRIGQVQTAELMRKTPPELDARRRKFVAWRAASKKLLGSPGSEVSLEFKNGTGARVRLKLERVSAPGEPVQFGSLPVLYAHLQSNSLKAGEKEVGLIRFNIWMVPTALAFNKAIDEHRGKQALIIDLRGNVGGMVGMIIGVAGHLTPDPIILGTLIARDNTLKLPANPRFVDTAGHRVEPFAGPVAILVDEITASASEVFTGGLQHHQRVRVFGRTTAGQALPAVYHELPNGDALYHPIADFITGDVRFEGRGVIPDEEVPLQREALLAGRDPTLESALNWIRTAK